MADAEEATRKEIQKPFNLSDYSSSFKSRFSRNFYEAMSKAGYTKFSPEKLAKIYKRLEDIALCEYVEPRDNINAAKLILQYNDMDISQLQKASEEKRDTAALEDIKNMVNKLKNEFGIGNKKVIDITNETSIS